MTPESLKVRTSSVVDECIEVVHGQGSVWTYQNRIELLFVRKNVITSDIDDGLTDHQLITRCVI